MDHPTESKPCRSFGLADAMISVAATAVAPAWLRKSLEYQLTLVSDGRIVENRRPSTIVGAACAAT